MKHLLPATALQLRSLIDASGRLEISLVDEPLPVPAGRVGVYVSEAMVDLYDARPGTEVDIVRPTFVYREIQKGAPWQHKPREVKSEDWNPSQGFTLGSLWSDHIGRYWRERNTEILGHEVVQVARARVIAEGDPATLELRDGELEARAGDLILAVDGQPIADLTGFYEKMWSLGEAGVTVPLKILREGDAFEMEVRSMDRASLLKRRRLN